MSNEINTMLGDGESLQLSAQIFEHLAAAFSLTGGF